MAGTPLRNLRMFERLCGVDALRNVMLVTTMWSESDVSTALSHEEELRTKYWSSMISAGSRIARFDYNQESAWAIVGHLKGTPLPVQLQVELVDEGKPLAYTSAGSALYQWFENIISQLRDLVLKLEARLRGKPSGNLAKETDAAKNKLRKVTIQRDRLSDRYEEPLPISSELATQPYSLFSFRRSESWWSGAWHLHDECDYCALHK